MDYLVFYQTKTKTKTKNVLCHSNMIISGIELNNPEQIENLLEFLETRMIEQFGSEVESVVICNIMRLPI